MIEDVTNNLSVTETTNPSAPTTGEPVTPGDVTTEPTTGSITDKVGKEASKVFTEEQVNNIMRDRVSRTQRSLLNRYGVKNRDELDGMIGKAQSYQIIKDRYEERGQRISDLERELSFVNNNINPKRQDDIMAYFKGKGLDFTEENLQAELITHPEWLNVVKTDTSPKTTIKTLGVDRQPTATPETEDERIARVFGL